MIQPIGFGSVTGHLIMKHPMLVVTSIIALMASGTMVDNISSAEAAKVVKVAEQQPGIDGKNAKYVALTFDDGFETDYTVAAPLLQKYDMRGTFYAMKYNPELFSTEYRMTTKSQREMLVNVYDWEEGWHTLTHPHLKELNETDLLHEMTPVDTVTDVKAFASPFGEYNENVLKVAKELGFTTHVKASNGVDGEDNSNWLPIEKNLEINRVLYTTEFDLIKLCKEPRDSYNVLVVGFHKVISQQSPVRAQSYEIDEKVLESFLKCLQEENYSTMTISELLSQEMK